MYGSGALVMVMKWHHFSLLLLTGLVQALGFCTVGFAFGYSPVIQQVQTNLTAQGFDPGVLDGVMADRTMAAIEDFQSKSNLPVTGKLDDVTLDKLAIRLTIDKTKPVQDWQPLPSQAEIDTMVAENAYADYVAYAPGVNLNIPGRAILEAMNQSADTFGSRRVGQARHTYKGYKALSVCLKTEDSTSHWSDLVLHYYCQMSLPRVCYSAALTELVLSRESAYAGCARGEFAKSADFSWVVKNQPLVFQYVMFGQAHAFNHEQAQAVINTFYGVVHPNDPRECRLKRPRRSNDPLDGTHCLVDKVMLKKLVGNGA